MNTDIAALQTIVDVLQDNDCVTDVVPVVEGTTIIGYTLRFLHHAPITIYHGEKSEKGEKGDKGDEGLTPTIGIRQDTGGVWYWTLNGEWLTDSLGNKIKAESRDGKDGENGQDGKDGEDGQDGVTPRLKIEEGRPGMSPTPTAHRGKGSAKRRARRERPENRSSGTLLRMRRTSTSPCPTARRLPYRKETFAEHIVCGIGPDPHACQLYPRTSLHSDRRYFRSDGGSAILCRYEGQGGARRCDGHQWQNRSRFRRRDER